MLVQRLASILTIPAFVRHDEFCAMFHSLQGNTVMVIHQVRTDQNPFIPLSPPVAS